MKKLILFIIICACAAPASMAQLTVKGDNFVFSKGVDIYVENEINLIDADSRFYLRGEAELMQENDVPNEGNGFLSIYQEGTESNFTYNYWSAPVSDNSSATDGNVGFIATDQIYYPVHADPAIPDDFTIDANNATILPYNQVNGRTDDGSPSNPLEIAGRWLWKYDSSISSTSGYAGWQIINGGQTVPTGYGFTMKGVASRAGDTPNLRSFGLNAGQRYDFRGRPNNGRIEVGVGNDNTSVIGNPYPSHLDLKEFLELNANDTGSIPGSDMRIDPIMYFFDSQDTGSHYLTNYSNGYGEYVPNGFNRTAGEYDNDGAYIPPVWRRYDSAGNIISENSGTGPVAPPGTTRRYLPPGQGFLISRTNTSYVNANGFTVAPTPALTPGVTTGGFSASYPGDFAYFENYMRMFSDEGIDSYFKASPANGTPQNARSSRVVPILKMNVVVKDTFTRPIYLQFDDSASLNDYDAGWETYISSMNPSDIYRTQSDGRPYSMTTQSYNEDMRIPLEVHVASNETAPVTFEFEMKEMINFNPPHVYVYDSVTDTYHEISNGNHIVSVAPGNYSDRFEITFKNTSGTLSTDTTNYNGFQVLQNNRRQELTILNPELKDVANVALYDLAGRQVFAQPQTQAQQNYSFETAGLSSAIYIVKITTQNNEEAAVKISVAN
ncbi:T9SS type A sorting domain-containing protein [Nonlabens xiamenensis]|uniref:T9SS type A sorting domain-containing protein n=1 Tax=Nonlabens xiamenensis TaxID=2341043 RepID=UPI0013DE5FED|nr:T9SS type A sorting domain-containing protein [Nonlabens xiamenensis]